MEEEEKRILCFFAKAESNFPLFFSRDEENRISAKNEYSNKAV
jgi:hypothetical protein